MESSGEYENTENEEGHRCLATNTLSSLTYPVRVLCKEPRRSLWDLSFEHCVGLCIKWVFFFPTRVKLFMASVVNAHQEATSELS